MKLSKPSFLFALCSALLPALAAVGLAAAQDDGAVMFDGEIAPLLARHCLECHDGATRKGKLDLSRKDHALAGGKTGPAIVPGNAAESLAWQAVHAGEMPEDRPALSPGEKAALRKWIDAGAIWTSDAIDPQAHTRDRRAAVQWVWRLTVPEYIETVRSAVGVNLEREARQLLPKDSRADGFSNTAYNLKVDLAHVEAYARLAEQIVSRMDVPKFAARFGNSGDVSEAAMQRLISRMGKWILRGPLAADEAAAYSRVAAAIVKDGGDFREAASGVLEAMLQSPRFIYRIENHRGDGQSRALSGHEVASRLSYMIWGGPPDEELLRAADAGELEQDAAIEAQVTRMLADARAVRRSRQFLDEWLDLERLENLRPNKARFPQWNSQLAADMREETLAFFEDVVWKQKRPLADLLNAQVTFATPRLAKHYGLDRKLAADAASRPEQKPLPQPGTPGLQALYVFDVAGDSLIRDAESAGGAMDLKIDGGGAVKWTGNGMTVDGSVVISTPEAPKQFVSDAKQTKEVTLEVWITPENRTQNGPARILTLSSGVTNRNFTLGQDGDKLEIRFRATKSDANGLPALSSPAGVVKTRRMHIVYTRDGEGKTRLYIDGEQKAAGDARGDLSNWDENFRLFLGNESTRDRPWRGTYHRVALYTRALSADEARRHFASAKGGEPDAGVISRYDLTSVPSRGGLLTQGSLLTIGGDDASMVTRGLFVLRDLLFSAIGSAPAGTDTRPVPPKPGQSRRVVAEGRVANKECASCHVRFEPLAFGLEKFDGVGGFREVDEHGNPLREDGQIAFPDIKDPVAYRSIPEFMDLLAKSDRVRKNLTRKVTQFAIGRPLIESDARVVDAIHEATQRGGGTYSSLIKAIALSDLTRKTRTEVLVAQNQSNP